MAVPIVTTPDTAYATKDNIVYPGGQTAATAAETRAQAELNLRFPSLTITVDSGAVKVSP